jgi:site-specific DNA recombinase
MSRLRCAVYARFSSDRQSPTSIDDQVRKCREHAARNDWEVLDRHIYIDEAVSGASTERDGLQKLLAAVTQPSHPFDCILIDDSSRLTRRLADALNLYERLAFAGIRVVAVSQGVDTENPQAELLIGVHGLIDAVYWRELGQKTHRGMQGLALRGLHTGGRCFGYTSVKNEDGSARLEVNEVQAEIVRRIFRLCGESGYSLKRIAHTLNSEGVLAPQPQKGRFSRSWCVSSVRHVLLNRKYVGKTVWNTKRKVRVPGTSKRVYRRRPESEWTTLDAPQLRIVTDELFAAAGRRFEKVKRLYGRAGNESKGLIVGPRRYLFSGLLKCSECGGSITLVSGRGRNGADRYGCSLHHQRGDSVCTNSLLVRRDELEESLLRGLAESVLRTEVIDFAVEKMEEALSAQFAGIDDELARLRQRKQALDSELKHLTDALAQGRQSQSIMAAIGEREEELRSITDRLLEPRPGSLRAKLDELRTFAVSRLTKIRELLAHPENVEKAHEAIAERVGQLTLEATNENGKRTYLAHGKVDFFGEEGVSHSGGAGGQNRTGYARLFRAALYQ